jgi:outer membrane lipoprotein SlyB
LRPFIPLLLPCLLLAGCGGSYSPNTYDAAAAQQANKVERGTIVGVRAVKISAQGTVGTVTGGAAGGIAGAQTPLGPVTRAFTALGGTVLGGIAGSAAEHAVGDTDAWEYIVREPNGELVSVTQKDQTPLTLGLAVLVITGKQARIVPDYTVPIAPAEASLPLGKAVASSPPATPARTDASAGAAPPAAPPPMPSAPTAANAASPSATPPSAAGPAAATAPVAAPTASGGKATGSQSL